MLQKVLTRRTARTSSNNHRKKAVPKLKKKWVYLFDEVDQVERYAKNWEGVRALLGGKGADRKSVV